MIVYTNWKNTNFAIEGKFKGYFIVIKKIKKISTSDSVKLHSNCFNISITAYNLNYLYFLSISVRFCKILNLIVSI